MKIRCAVAFVKLRQDYAILLLYKPTTLYRLATELANVIRLATELANVIRLATELANVI